MIFLNEELQRKNFQSTREISNQLILSSLILIRGGFFMYKNAFIYKTFIKTLSKSTITSNCLMFIFKNLWIPKFGKTMQYLHIYLAKQIRNFLFMRRIDDNDHNKNKK